MVSLSNDGKQDSNSSVIESDLNLDNQKALASANWFASSQSKHSPDKSPTPHSNLLPVKCFGFFPTGYHSQQCPNAAVCVCVFVHGEQVLPEVEPLRVFRKGFRYGGEMSEGTVDLFNTRTAATTWAGQDGT